MVLFTHKHFLLDYKPGFTRIINNQIRNLGVISREKVQYEISI